MLPFATNLADGPRTPLRDDRGESVKLVDEQHGGARNVDIHLNHLLPGSGSGPRHFHERAENVYIVLSGSIEVDIDEDTIALGADDVLFIPPGVVHATSNPGSEVAVFIEVYAPAGEDFHVVAEPD
jgi:mannose-6-phosphate isomerase-like protein (cupin superfamily)